MFEELDNNVSIKEPSIVYISHKADNDNIKGNKKNDMKRKSIYVERLNRLY